MGILDGLAGQVLGGLAGGQGANPLLQAAMDLVQNHPGGLSGLLQQFEGAGLGQHAASWVGTGQNMAVTGDQVHAALGGQIAQIAGQLNIPHADVASGLAQLLPQIIDQLTPKGQVAQGADLQGALGALAGQLFKR